jgi:ADYC domain
VSRPLWFVLGLLALTFIGALPVIAGPPDSNRIRTVKVIGTAFRVILATGKRLEGAELAGATISISLLGEPQPRRIRLARIIPDPTDPEGDVLLYDMRVLDPATGAGTPLCEHIVDGGHWAFPLRGQWDRNGTRISDEGFTLTCAADAQGKCVRFGYKPWRKGPGGVDLAAYHQACVRMVRAAYCGNKGTTRNGMLIDFYDRLGIQHRTDTPDDRALPFEAVWNADGALCVAHTRVPEHMTLERLARSCPRLRGRLGKSTCTEAAALAGRLGDVLLLNRSR